MKHVMFSMLLMVSFFVTSYVFAQDHHHGHENGEGTKPMVEIMQGMDTNLHKLTSAIMAEDYALIASSAHDIANHPGIDQEYLHKLFERLGSKKEAFIACDTAVHNLAQDVSKAGKAHDMNLVLEKYSAMLRKAVECHKNYR